MFGVCKGRYKIKGQSDMLEIKGIKNGAVLQRDEKDFCNVLLEADFKGMPKTSMGELMCVGDGKWRLTNIYVGGPYIVNFEDEEDSISFTDIYVGDLWLLAGQSNMEGAGVMTSEDDYEAANPTPFIRAFYMDDVWDDAKPILHHLNLSADKAHRDTWQNNLAYFKKKGLEIYDNPSCPTRRQVGPGYFFAKEMFSLTDGIPQGLIPAAVGGAPIGMWLPSEEGEENYYTAACRRIEETGNNIKGVFWAQGENNPEWEVYPSQIESIREDLCRRMGKTQIPLVQMQSHKCTIWLNDEEADYRWSRFREMQRKMSLETPMLMTIATNDLELEDCIHLSSSAQKISGIRGAKAMNYLVSGRGCAEPMLDTVYVTPCRYTPTLFSEIHVRYKNVMGSLSSSGIPFGFFVRKKDSKEKPSMQMFRKISLKQNEVVIGIEISQKELLEYELWYGFGNSYYCNITDGENRAIPAMGPISIGKYVNFLDNYIFNT
jgi:sialate O-acetylesterase